MSIKRNLVVCILTSLFAISTYLLASRSIERWNDSSIAREFAGHKLAVILPYRCVFGELQIFIPKVHEFLNNKKISHKFYVIRQADDNRFNRGSLINIGYLMSRDECNYMVMHDIDTIPLNPQLNYGYPDNGPHLLSPREYHPEYNGSRFSGGVLSITMEHFRQLRGMTNKYWGWGGEDNEFYTRMQKSGLHISKSENLSTNKSNTFMNIHDVRMRPRDKDRFYAVKMNVFKIHKDSGFDNVRYELQSTTSMAISDVSFTVYNVKLFCEDSDVWCH